MRKKKWEEPKGVPDEEYAYAYEHRQEDEDECEWQQVQEEWVETDASFGCDDETQQVVPAGRRKNPVLKSLIVMLIVALGGLGYLWFTVFRLENVRVSGNINKSKEQIAMASGLVKGLSMFTVNEEEIRRNLSMDHTLRLLGIQKEYPKTIHLYITEREPVAVFQWAGMSYVLDEEGMVLSESSNLDVPLGMVKVTGFEVKNKQVPVGQVLAIHNRKQMEAFQSFMQELQLQLYVNQIRELSVYNPDNLFMITTNGMTIRLGTGQYAQAKVGAMRTVMAYLGQMEGTIGTLDVSIPQDPKFRQEN